MRSHPTKSIVVALLFSAFAILAAACGSSSSSSSDSTTQGDLKEVTVSLDYVANNAGFAGFFVAIDKGYYEEAGLDVTVRGYTDTTADVLVNAGQADFGTIDQATLIMDRAAGQPLTAVMTLMQHDPQRIAIATKNTGQIETPKDLEGKTFGGFGVPIEPVLNDTVIAEDGGNPDYETVTLGTGVYDALTSGSVDWAIPYETDDILWAEMKGEGWDTLNPLDYGVPDMYAKLVFTSQELIDEDPELVSAFVQATAKGFADAQADPEAAIQILAAADVGPLEMENQIATAEALAEGYWLDPDGNVGPMVAERWTLYAEFLADAGVLVDNNGDPLDQAPDATQWFTNEFLSGPGS